MLVYKEFRSFSIGATEARKLTPGRLDESRLAEAWCGTYFLHVRISDSNLEYINDQTTGLPRMSSNFTAPWNYRHNISFMYKYISYESDHQYH